MFLPIFSAIIIIVIDQIVKYWTVNNIPLYSSQTGLPGVFDFYHIHNEGAGWGLLSGRINFFIIITVIVVIYLCLLIYQNRRYHWLTRLSYGMLLGGALGNFIDRIRLGYVIDMFRLTFMEFPIFNVADVMLSVGVGLLIFVMVFNFDTGEVL